MAARRRKRSHPIADTALYALQAIGIQDEVFDSAVELTVGKGTVLRSFGRQNDVSPSRFLAGYPPEAGMMVAGEADSEGVPTDAQEMWPYADYGLPQRMKVEQVLSENGFLGRALRGVVRGADLVVFDTFCDSIDRGIKAGDEIDVRMHAWGVRLGNTKPTEVKVADLPPELRQRQGADDDGTVTMFPLYTTEGAAAVSPAMDKPSPLYILQSRIKAVRSGKPLLDCPTWVLTVSLARPEGKADVDVELTVTDMVWHDPTPVVGADITGVIWLQACLV